MPTQLDFDEPPLYDAILDFRVPNKLSGIWISYWSSFYQTLISYLSQNGIFLPILTTLEQADLDNDTLVNGQLIYNITVDAPQFWQTSANAGLGGWRTITYT